MSTKKKAAPKSKETKAPAEYGSGQAAQLIGVPRRTLQTMLKDGRAKGRQVTAGAKSLWFVAAKEVERLKAAHAKAEAAAAGKRAVKIRAKRKGKA